MTEHYPYTVNDFVVATKENHTYPKGQLGTIVEFYDGYPVVLFNAERLAEVFDYDEVEPYCSPQEKEGPESSFAMAWDEFAQALDGIGSRADYNHTNVDPVEHPEHYTSSNIECIDYLKDNMPYEAFLGFLEGNTKKYMHRWRYKKKPVEDLSKSRWYLNRLIKELGGDEGA